MSDQKQMKKRRVTVKDVARDLGMSVATVSRAFYPGAVIAEKTRSTVLNRASELGYRPNPFAQSLITKKTQIAGMIVSDLPNPFYPEVLTEMTGQLQAAGMNVMLAAAHEPEKIDEAVELMLSYQPDVVIILAANLASDARERCESAGAPVIFFNRLSADGLGYGISCDNEAGGRQAADHLIDKGHSKLLYVSAFPHASTNVERQKGFCERAIERGVEPPHIIEAGRFSYEAGYAAGLDKKRLDKPIDGVFCANDIVAIGFIQGVQEGLGLRVPDDISVIGFDDITMAGWPSHKLTTVPQPLKQMMAATVALARALANDEEVEAQTQRFAPGGLIERNTTKSRLPKNGDIN